jgi:hypothetical protein
MFWIEALSMGMFYLYSSIVFVIHLRSVVVIRKMVKILIKILVLLQHDDDQVTAQGILAHSLMFVGNPENTPSTKRTIHEIRT